MDSTTLNKKQSQSCGLSDYINRGGTTGHVILGHNKTLVNITPEQIKEIQNELSNETKLLSGSLSTRDSVGNK